MSAAHVMCREDGVLLAQGIVRDPKTGEKLSAEERRHAGAGIVTWVCFPDGWRITQALFFLPA